MMLSTFKSVLFTLIIVLALLVIGISNAKATAHGENDPPAVVIRGGNLNDGPRTDLTPFTAIVGFTKSIAGFDIDTITIINGAVTTFGPIDGFDSSVVTITPNGGSENTSPVTGENPTDIVILIPENAVVADMVGNLGNTEGRRAIQYTPTPPEASFSAFPVSQSSTPFSVTVTLTEVATDFDANDVTVTPNTSTTTTPFTVSADDTVLPSGTGYTLSFTPNHSETITITIAVGSFTDPDGNLNVAEAELVIDADTTPPTASFSAYPVSHNGSSEFTVTVTLSEVATDFDATDVTVTPATPFTVSGDGTSYTLNFMPDHTNAITIAIPEGGFSDPAGRLSREPPDPLVILADTTPPTASFSAYPVGHNGSEFTVTVTLTEVATDFDATDVTVTPATPFTVSGDGTSYTLNFMPDHTNDISIAIAADRFTDPAGTQNAVATGSLPIPADTTPPTITFKGPETAPNNREEIEVTITSSDAFDGLDTSSVTASYATSIAITPISGTPGSYTAVVTPDGMGDILITIPVGGIEDELGNANTEAITFEVPFDSPAAMTLAGPGPYVEGLGEFTVTVTFTEAVTGFDNVGDIMLTNAATVTTGPTAVAGSDGRQYTLGITPDRYGEILITIIAGAAMNTGNFPSRVSDTLRVTAAEDITDPIVTLTGPTASDIANTFDSLEPFTVTVEFTEVVTGFEVADIEVNNGTITTGPTAVAGSDRQYTLDIRPGSFDVVTITIIASAVVDAFNNNNDAEEVLVTYMPVDTIRPLVMLTGAPDTATSRAPFPVTATFTEAVTGLEVVGIKVTNGAVTTLSGRGANYVLTITPDDDGDIEIIILKDAVLDIADNGNDASNLVRVTYDAIAPTVTLAGPDTLSNLEPFAVTATFSEVVTGFEVADIEVTNGAVTTFSGSGANYVLTLTPTGNGDLLVTIPAAVAVDAVTNGNMASDTLAVVNTIVADTQTAITGFMLARANNLARNQPGLTRFLQGTGCDGLSGNNAGASGSVGGCVSRGQAWGEFSSAWSSDSFYTLATLGTHKFVRDNLIIGGMVQFDVGDDDARNITGQGWLAGPYFVSKPADQNVSFEGRLLYGQTDNDISPLGSYRDSFDTDRYLAQLRVTGQYGYRKATLMPLLGFTYTEDTQQDYTDTLNNLIDEQGIDLTQVTFGVDFRLPVAVQMGQLDLTGGLSGTYSEVDGGESDVEGGRGRVELGLNYANDNGMTFAGGVFYDGITSDHESYGVNISLDIKF